MIRLVTSRRLRDLDARGKQARARAREVQGRADQAYSGYIRSLYEVTARAEGAESDAAILRDQVGELEAALGNVRAELDARVVVLLLRCGEPHSVHGSVQAAKEHAATLGADPSGWRPQAGPLGVSEWLIMPLRQSGGGAP